MIPFENFLKITLLAGWSNEEIYSQFIQFELPVTRDEICTMRAKLKINVESGKMIAENRQRHLNQEESYINKSVIMKFSFRDDATSLTSEITRIKKLSELKNFTFNFITIFSMEHLREPLENMLMVNNSPTLVREFIKQLALDGYLYPIHITDKDIRKYCYFFWNVLKYSQPEFSQYLKEKKELGFYKNYLDPSLEQYDEAISVKEERKALFRNTNKLFFEHLNNILDCLNEGKIPSNNDIDSLKIHSLLLKRLKRPKNIFNEIYSYADHQEGLALSDDYDIHSTYDFLAIPQYNLIRLLFYSGYQIEIIKKTFKILHYNQIPDYYYQKILDECNAIPEGRKMIEENSKRLPDAMKKFNLDRIKSLSEETKIIEKSSEQLSSQQEFYNSEEVRETFEFPEFYDAVINNPSDVFTCYEPLDSLLSLKNINSTTGLEILLLLGNDLKRINYLWKKQVGSELTEDQLKMYEYYFWNIPDFQYMYEEDFGLSLYNYLALNPSNKRYEDHQWLIKSSDALKILNYTDLANKNEVKEFIFESYCSIISKLVLAREKKEEAPKILIVEFKILLKKIAWYESQNELQRKHEGIYKFKANFERIAGNLNYYGDVNSRFQANSAPLEEFDPDNPIQDEPYLKDGAKLLIPEPSIPKKML